jgi:glycosyltransferase involved in cell wall biosynthesis
VTILILSFHFPPVNSIAAMRVSKTAHFLSTFGHTVHVVAARHGRMPDDNNVPMEAVGVSYTSWLHHSSLRLADPRSSGGAPNGSALTPLERLRRTASRLFYVPDWSVGWLPFALVAAVRAIRRLRPDVVFVSTGPYSILLLANILSRLYGIPWVVEFRDLWTQGHTYPYDGLRRMIDRALERWALGTAAALITVSCPLARKLETVCNKTVLVVENGYDPTDYPEDIRPFQGPAHELSIVYTGGICGRQDPQPFMDALRTLGPLPSLRVRFVGHGFDWVARRARQMGIDHIVECKPSVPYPESLGIQKGADALLLLLWDESESGVYTGKIFDYLGSGRPILAVGKGTCVAADLIRTRGAGVVCSTADEIEQVLRRWIGEKQRFGRIEGPPEDARRGFTREEQTRKIERLLIKVVSGCRRTRE